MPRYNNANDAPFQVGDTVRLKNGASPQRVRQLKWEGRSQRWYLETIYLSRELNNDGNPWRIAEDYIRLSSISPKITTERKEDPMPTLYQTKDKKPRFGTLLAKNSQGQMVLEMKGAAGDVEAFDADQLEEVMPYTVGLRRLTGGNGSHETRHYMGVVGDVEVGDTLLHRSNGSLWEVKALDTKEKKPHAPSTNGFLRIQGDRVKVGQVE